MKITENDIDSLYAYIQAYGIRTHILKRLFTISGHSEMEYLKANVCYIYEPEWDMIVCSYLLSGIRCVNFISRLRDARNIFSKETIESIYNSEEEIEEALPIFKKYKREKIIKIIKQ